VTTFSELSKSRSIAVSALRRNKLQTILTMSGMSVGVATVLTMVAVGSGAQKSIQDQVRSAGMNVIVVTSGNYKMKQQWTSDGETIIVWCDGIRFIHHILSDPDDDAPEFFSDDDQDPSVIVKLTDEERHELERVA